MNISNLYENIFVKGKNKSFDAIGIITILLGNIVPYDTISDAVNGIAAIWAMYKIFTK